MDNENRIHEIVEQVSEGHLLTADEIRCLLDIQHHSKDAGYIMAAADMINRKVSNGKAEVHAQIGLNLSGCPRNCIFCSFAEKYHIFEPPSELHPEQAVDMARKAEEEGANAIFFMCTGDYSLEKYLRITADIRRELQDETVMVANIGDFGKSMAGKLVKNGFSGIYHAIRMGEGQATTIDHSIRWKTIHAAREAGLHVGTCVEPVGPEHTRKEIVEKTILHRDLRPCFSGAARRITIPGSDLERYGMISEYEMAFIVAVVRLAMGDRLVGNCTHEPNVLGACSGANLFWAEVGANPRDTEGETSEGRGMDVKACSELFREADMGVLRGPSRIYSHENGQEG